MHECAARAAAVLRAGGIVLYPTDTLYGLGADALSNDAVAKIYSIKSRDERKPIHCIVADLAMARQYGTFSERAAALAEKFLPGPLTIVVEKKDEIDTGVCRNIGTIGFRIPDNDFCIELARVFGKPYTTTSANFSGEASERSVEKILAQLGGAASHIDLVVDAGELPERAPSTVVGVSGPDVVVLREGAISVTGAEGSVTGDILSG